MGKPAKGQWTSKGMPSTASSLRGEDKNGLTLGGPYTLSLDECEAEPALKMDDNYNNK